MKKTMYIFSIAASLFLVSCGGSADNGTDGGSADGTEEGTEEEEEVAEVSIVGTWQMSDLDMGMEIPEGQEELFKTMKEELIKSSSMVFNEDGTMNAKASVDGQASDISGTYTLEGDQLKTVADGKEDTQTVSELTETTLVLKMVDEGTTMTMTYSR
jgi:flagellar hook assembly protein FlgD